MGESRRLRDATGGYFLPGFLVSTCPPPCLQVIKSDQ